MPQIDPKFTFWFAIWTKLLVFVSSYGVEHAPTLIQQYAPSVQWVLGMFAQGNDIVLIALIGVSSSKLGPLVSVPASAVKPVVILAALIMGMFAFSGDASAQGFKLKPLNQTATPVPATKPAAVAPDALSKIMDDIEKVQQDVVDGIVIDINAADADAGFLLNPADPSSFKDPISHACYPAAVKFLQSLPTATPTTGKFVVVQLFQKKRDFVAQIKAGLPVYLKLGCAPLLGDEVAVLTKLLGLVGVQVGANMLVPGLGLALPTL